MSERDHQGLPGPAQQQGGVGGEEENLDGLGASLKRKASQNTQCFPHKWDEQYRGGAGEGVSG